MLASSASVAFDASMNGRSTRGGVHRYLITRLGEAGSPKSRRTGSGNWAFSSRFWTCASVRFLSLPGSSGGGAGLSRSASFTVPSSLASANAALSASWGRPGTPASAPGSGPARLVISVMATSGRARPPTFCGPKASGRPLGSWPGSTERNGPLGCAPGASGPSARCASLSFTGVSPPVVVTCSNAGTRTRPAAITGRTPSGCFGAFASSKVSVVTGSVVASTASAGGSARVSGRPARSAVLSDASWPLYAPPAWSPVTPVGKNTSGSPKVTVWPLRSVPTRVKR
ncbi:hypothetical protein [Streptomyces hainanensis]|uniref:Uncharacterized protein n=1 Tax=Streptomyces hainanensis TaxID=402648 RepID=A0A4R4TLU7_9ACTN|nr:hypothetical protein [Streptomyces hainanensis]TDC76774.1 hypothetical protein E1283_09000 [Streptomyces hainanensis]